MNITAVTRLAHTFAGRLAARGKGGIVLFGSIVGWQGVPGQANYAASKAYVQSLAEGLHDELKPRGVDVLAVAPGPVDSGFGATSGPDDDIRHLARGRRDGRAQRARTADGDSGRPRQVPHVGVDATAPAHS